MSHLSKKTVLRSIRITAELDQLLQKDARAKGLSFNALLSSLLTKYAQWDRYTERFGFIDITRDGFRRIQEVITDKNRVKVAQELGTRNPKEMVSFWFKNTNITTYLLWLSTYCMYGHIAQYELEVDGTDYIITLHHDLGLEYSTFLGHYVSQSVKTMLNITPQLDVSKNSVSIRITSPRS